MKGYIAYKCEVCGMEFVISTDGLRIADITARYLACPLGHRPIRNLGEYESVKECMESQDTYQRVNGRIKQTRYKGK